MAISQKWLCQLKKQLCSVRPPSARQLIEEGLELRLNHVNAVHCHCKRLIHSKSLLPSHNNGVRQWKLRRVCIVGLTWWYANQAARRWNSSVVVSDIVNNVASNSVTTSNSESATVCCAAIVERQKAYPLWKLHELSA